MSESFGFYLQRKQMEMARAENRRVGLKDFAAHIERQVNNPLLKVRHSKLSGWKNNHMEPQEEIKALIKQALGE